MKAPIRVLYMTESGRLFGSEAYMLNEIRGLDRSRMQPVAVVGSRGELIERLEAEGVPTLVLPHRPRSGMATRVDIVRVNAALFRLLHRERIDLVVANTTAVLPFLMFAAKAAGRPVISRVLTTNWLEITDRWLLGLSDAITFETDAVRQALIRPRRSDFITRIPREKIRLIRACRSAEEWQADDGGAFRRELGLRPETPLIGMVAAFDPRKGQDLLIQAMPAILARCPATQAVLVGNAYRDRPGQPDYLMVLQDLARRLGVERAVHFTGFRTDVARIIPALDVALLLSHREAAGGVLIEYMMCGRPIVAARTEGIPETTGEDGAALLVPKADPAAAAQAVARILTDRGLAARMGQAGRSRAMALFSADVVRQETERLYAEVLQRRGRASAGRLVSPPAAAGEEA